MRRVVICALLLAAMTALGVFIYTDTENVTAEAVQELELLEQAALIGDRQYIAVNAKKLSERWESFCCNNFFLTNNEGAFEVSQSLVRIIALAEGNADGTAEECREARMLVELYAESRRMSIANIF